MLKNLPLREKTIVYIKSEIQHGNIRKNQIINEATICEKLGISRTPVREALIQLVSDGVLKRIPSKGYEMVEFDSKKKTDTYEVIAVLDAFAATLSVESMTDDDISKMNEITDKMDIAIKYMNYSEYYNLQEVFHDIYIDKCGNDVLIGVLGNLKHGPIKQTYSGDDKEKLFKIFEETQKEHRHIVNLFAKKKSDELGDFLRYKHWSTVYPENI